MADTQSSIAVYLEVGKTRTFAGALEWPGWCRTGRDEESALRALVDCGPRYAAIIRAAAPSFQPPADVATFAVAERLAGTTTTDFGAPGVAPASDARPVDGAELQRLSALLEACWVAFDAAVAAAAGVPLRTGPRGGGRDLVEIVRHTLDAERAYLARLGWQKPKLDAADPIAAQIRARQAALAALAAAARGEIPARGPRGGAIWSPRYFVRRAAWHIIDHIWEIEDRARPQL